MTSTGRSKQDLPMFTDEDNPDFVPLWLAQNIMDDYHFATHEESEQMYVYEDGVYKPRGEIVAKQEAQSRLERYRKNHYINETVETLKIENYTPAKKFNNPNNGLVVKNGLLDLETKKLKDHTPEHIHITKIPWEYDPKADCPEIKEFVGEVVHEDDVKLIQEMFGYCLLKDYPYAKAFMLLGSGANGKSTLLDLLERLLGEDNVATPSLQELLNNRFSRIELYGKLANIHADLSAEKLEKTGTFKMLTGGDTIRGEKKYQDAITFKNHAKLIYSANNLPRTEDRTEAFFRRWIVIEFPNQFTEDKEDTDPDLPDKLINEESMSGLLNWAIEGLERIQEQDGFSKTKSRAEIEEKWIRETDSLRAFVDEAVEKDSDSFITKEKFYQVYCEWTDKHNVFTVKNGQVTKRLQTLLPQTELFKPKVGDKQKRAWRNIKWSDNFIESYDTSLDDEHYRQDRQCLSTTSIETIKNSNSKKGSEKSLSKLSTDEGPQVEHMSVDDEEPSSVSKTVKDFLVDHPGAEKEAVYGKAQHEHPRLTSEKFDKLFEKMKKKGDVVEYRSGEGFKWAGG